MPTGEDLEVGGNLQPHLDIPPKEPSKQPEELKNPMQIDGDNQVVYTPAASSAAIDQSNDIVDDGNQTTPKDVPPKGGDVHVSRSTKFTPLPGPQILIIFVICSVSLPTMYVTCVYFSFILSATMRKFHLCCNVNYMKLSGSSEFASLLISLLSA